MVLIRFDIAEKRYYEEINGKRVYLTKEQVSQKILRVAKWQTISHKAIRTLEKRTNRILERIGYVLQTWEFNLSVGDYRCGRCKRNEGLYLQPRATAMFVTCSLCGTTSMLARHEHKEHLSDRELPIADYITDYFEKEVTFEFAVKWWKYHKGRDMRGLKPHTADMMQACGFMP